jgi:hypothetical protein
MLDARFPEQWLKSTNFQDVSSCSSVQVQGCITEHTVSIFRDKEYAQKGTSKQNLASSFNSEDRGCMFHQNVTEPLPNHSIGCQKSVFFLRSVFLKPHVQNPFLPILIMQLNDLLSRPLSALMARDHCRITEQNYTKAIFMNETTSKTA